MARVAQQAQQAQPLLREIRADRPRLSVVKQLLAGGAAAEMSDGDVSRLCKNQQYDILLAFLDAGMDPNRRSEDGRTLLIGAVTGLAARIYEMLKRGRLQYPDLGRVVEPLRAFVGVLVERGARLDDQDDTGATALIALCELEYGLFNGAGVALVRALLEAGAEVGLADGAGRTALHAVLANPTRYQFTPSGVEIVRALLEAGADVNAADHEGYTPLLLVASHELIAEDAEDAEDAEAEWAEQLGAVYDEDKAFTSRGEILELLKAAGADPTAKVRRGRQGKEANAFTFASERDNEGFFDSMLNYREEWKAAHPNGEKTEGERFEAKKRAYPGRKGGRRNRTYRQKGLKSHKGKKSRKGKKRA